MKRTFLLTLLLVTLVLASHIPSIAGSSDTSETVVANLEKQYFEALENQDQELMDSLLDDSFVISSMSSDKSMKKKAFLTTLPKQVITSQEITAIKVDVEGDKANSQVDISMTKTYDGSDHSGDYEVYSVWVHKDGNWKLLERKIKFLNPPE
ncbi:MAG: nuclear transport factor 2 family protein [Thermodesulfobacteriota bacterium]